MTDAITKNNIFNDNHESESMKKTFNFQSKTLHQIVINGYEIVPDIYLKKNLRFQVMVIVIGIFSAIGNGDVWWPQFLM